MLASLKRLRSDLVLLLAAFLFSGEAALAVKPPPKESPTVSYTLIPLGVLSDQDYSSVAYGLNDAGDVVGTSSSKPFISYCVEDARQIRDVNDFLVGRQKAEWLVRAGYDINNRYSDIVQVVGFAQKYEVEEIEGEWVRGARIDDYYYAVRVTLDLSSFASEGMLDDLGFTGIANGINDYGDVVGTVYPGDVACIYTDDHAQGEDGITVLPLFGEALYSDGVAINNALQATGNTYMEQHWIYRAWRYSLSEGMLDLGGIKGKPGIGIESQGRSINDSGDVVGWSTAGKAYHGFLYTDAAGLVDLGDLGGGYSDATGINNTGIVTGVARTADGSIQYFVYDSRGTDPKMLRVDVGGPLSVLQGGNPRINSSGCISCSPMMTEGRRACLLIPVLPSE